jgi:DNA-binding response OmpR family regulator
VLLAEDDPMIGRAIVQATADAAHAVNRVTQGEQVLCAAWAGNRRGDLETPAALHE